MSTASVPLRRPLFRGGRRLRIALLGLPGAGTSTIFRAVQGAAAGEADIDIGFDQARVVELPATGDLSGADVVIQVLDATNLGRDLALTLELLARGRPLVLAMNKMDAAREKGMHVGTRSLAERLGVPVVPTSGAMGYGIRELFSAAADAARTFSTHALQPLSAENLAEIAVRPGGVRERHDWRYWLDEVFLSPRWGLFGSALVFAAVLFVVFGVSAWIDGLTTARLAEALSAWQPATLGGVLLRAVADGLVGLVGIVVPYMIPLVLLLIVLEQAGIMARIAFALDRIFHRLGLHGDVALPLLLGLGCNVPALASLGRLSRGPERTIASMLVAFVPCSARSAIVLALAGKYLGAWGVLAVLGAAALVIALLGTLLRRGMGQGMPGHIQEIPRYALLRPKLLLSETWARTKDVLTIVTPLLVAGSVVLALLSYGGAERAINAALSPLTAGLLGLPVALGVPLLFGVLRKELSLVMIYQALGSFDVSAHMDARQILVFLVFLTLYVPCLSTFAVMTRTIGARHAAYSVCLSIGIALAAAVAVRVGLGLM
ncbi:MAG TPA: nucleoside recognition domain-containing protein [Burkholderiales bacterium]|nr:nucleoside recognition domain-containing protein [Burkholderiales bacterium]